jgi:membrane glycosyltransferase
MKSFPAIESLKPDVISLRHALFLATGAGITICGIVLMVAVLRVDGFAPLEWVLLALFVPLFGQIAFGFAIALWGFLILTSGGDRYQIMRTLPDPPVGGPVGATAIVLPVFNEDPDRTFRGLENMFRSLESTGAGGSFDFFVLSDSNEPDRWIEEETAWFRLCSRCQAFGRIFYRKRRSSLNGKSGNIADFCRRWGKRYQYLLILDADSVMSGETILRLARVMDANPRAGIVQTAPNIIRGRSLLQRFIQFATRLVGPLFAAGSNFWHLGGGNYWGHNAIIRLKPFIEQCVLPVIPGRRAADRHILSHDTVEAALMHEAGYQVWLAYLEDGSYEEGPPNLTESLKRDRRWCQGNLQHFWFLFAPGTPFTNRIHIFFGLMAYLTAPLLVLFIALSSWDNRWKQQFKMFSALDVPVSAGWAPTALLVLTLTLLFLPKFLGVLHLLPRAGGYGGVMRLFLSTILETLLSVLVAPILLFFYTRFVLLTMLGLRVAWKTQNRNESAIPFGEAVKTYWGATLSGILAGAATLLWAPSLIFWLSPVLVGLLLSIPFAMITSSEKAGLLLKKLGLFLIPEESALPPVLRNLDCDARACAEGALPKVTNDRGNGRPARLETEARSNTSAAHGRDAHAPRKIPAIATFGHAPSAVVLPGVLQLAISPEVNALHSSLLRRSRVHASHQADYLAGLRKRLLEQGPQSLSRRELNALLWDRHAVESLHRDIWLSAETGLHPWWRHALRHYNESSVLLDRREIVPERV